MYQLDHIVHFVNRPENLVELTRKIGLHTVAGGKHEMWGTYNSLTYFGLSYVEFIGVFNHDLLEKSALKPYTLHESYVKRNRKSGFTRIALRTESIEEDAEKFRAIGLEVFGPETFSRVRPDGSAITWKLLHFGKLNLPVDYPFFIQWEGNDQERYSELTENGTIAEHILGNLHIEEISYKVEDLRIAREWAKLFDFTIAAESTHFIKLKTPTCLIGFYQSNEGQNEISQVKISGAVEEKEVIIEEGNYQFVE